MNDSEKEIIRNLYYESNLKDAIDFPFLKKCRQETCRGFAEIKQYLCEFIKETYGVNPVFDIHIN